MGNTICKGRKDSVIDRPRRTRKDRHVTFEDGNDEPNELDISRVPIKLDIIKEKKKSNFKTEATSEKGDSTDVTSSAKVDKIISSAPSEEPQAAEACNDVETTGDDTSAQGEVNEGSSKDEDSSEKPTELDEIVENIISPEEASEPDETRFPIASSVLSDTSAESPMENTESPTETVDSATEETETPVETVEPESTAEETETPTETVEETETTAETGEETETAAETGEEIETTTEETTAEEAAETPTETLEETETTSEAVETTTETLEPESTTEAAEPPTEETTAETPIESVDTEPPKEDLNTPMEPVATEVLDVHSEPVKNAAPLAVAAIPIVPVNTRSSEEQSEQDEPVLPITKEESPTEEVAVHSPTSTLQIEDRIEEGFNEDALNKSKSTEQTVDHENNDDIAKKSGEENINDLVLKNTDKFAILDILETDHMRDYTSQDDEKIVEDSVSSQSPNFLKASDGRLKMVSTRGFTVHELN